MTPTNLGPPLYVAYFHGGNTPRVIPVTNGRNPPGMHAQGDSAEAALQKLLTLVEVAEAKTRTEHANLKLRRKHLEDMNDPKVTSITTPPEYLRAGTKVLLEREENAMEAQEIERLRDVLQSVICDPGCVGLSDYTKKAIQSVRGKPIDPNKYVLVERSSLEAVEKENKRLTLKCRNSLANNLCPDHHDKQAGKSCLACEIERRTARVAELDQIIDELRWRI